MKSLARLCNIDDPESVKGELARRDVSEGTKEKYCWVYERYLRQHSMAWKRPRYRRIEKLPFVPTERDLDQLIGGLSKRLGTIVLFLKETGCRKGEMWAVKWVDIDPVRNAVKINSPEKNSLMKLTRGRVKITKLDPARKMPDLRLDQKFMGDRFVEVLKEKGPKTFLQMRGE